MKKLSTFIVVTLLLSVIAIAQPTLNSTNYTYAIGDNQLYYIADTNSVIDPTVGANVIFNYNGLRGYGMSQNQFIIDPTTTTYGPSDFASANYADTSNALSTNTRYSEVMGTDSLINLGFVANIQGYGDLIARYNTNPEILMKFPFDYGDSYVDNYSGTFTLLAQNTVGNSNVAVTADAWGQLQLPNGVVIDSVLRVRSVEAVLTDTIFLTSPVPLTILPVSINAEYINYLKPSLSKFPLLSYLAGSITQNAAVLDSNKTFISQYPLTTVGVKELHNNLVDMNLYPNPTNKEQVTLSLVLKEKSTVRIELRNKLGQFVRAAYSGEGINGTNNINISTADLSSGIYFVNVFMNGSSVAKKLVIQ